MSRRSFMRRRTDRKSIIHESENESTPDGVMDSYSSLHQLAFAKAMAELFLKRIRFKNKKMERETRLELATLSLEG